MMMLGQLGASGAFTAIPTTLLDRSVFYKHARSQMYSPSIFFVAKAIVDVPVSLVEQAIMTAIIGGMCNLNLEGHRYVYLWLNCALSSIAVSNFVRAAAGELTFYPLSLDFPYFCAGTLPDRAVAPYAGLRCDVPSSTWSTWSVVFQSLANANHL
jgi:hypothetical protein